MIALLPPSGFFVNGEWWAPDEWRVACQAWKPEAVARGYDLAKRQVWAEEHRLALTQRRPKPDEDEGILLYSRWLERRCECRN